LTNDEAENSVEIAVQIWGFERISFLRSFRKRGSMSRPFAHSSVAPRTWC